MVLTGLGDQALQVDEGSDTLVSTTILKYGVPRHSDGVNHTMDYADIHDGLFIYRTWFPYYLQALSLSVFGKTSVAARLPFALAGIASVICLYFFTLKLAQNRTAAFLSALFLASSVPALLYFRTARYAGLPILLTILLLYFYIKIFDDGKWRPAPFIATAVIFFHTMYVEFAGAVLGILIHFLVHRKSVAQENIGKPVWAGAVIAVFTLPWLIFIFPVFSKISQFYQSASSYVDPSMLGYLKHFSGYLFQINNYIFPLILFPLLWTRRLESWRKEIQLLWFCLLTIMVTASLHSIPLQQYIAAVFPLFFILLAMVIAGCFQAYPIVRWVLAGTLIATNLIHVGPLLPVKEALKRTPEWFDANDYLQYTYNTFMREVRPASVFYEHSHEITHPFQGPQDRVLRFFKTHGKPGDSCYIDNERDSLAFYTGMKLLHREDLMSGEIPDWIVLRGERRFLENDVSGSPVAGRLLKILQSNPYRKLELPGPINRINNSYDIQLHLFRIPSSADTILVYQLDRKPHNQETP